MRRTQRRKAERARKARELAKVQRQEAAVRAKNEKILDGEAVGIALRAQVAYARPMHDALLPGEENTKPVGIEYAGRPKPQRAGKARAFQGRRCKAWALCPAQAGPWIASDFRRIRRQGPNKGKPWLRKGDARQLTDMEAAALAAEQQALADLATLASMDSGAKYTKAEEYG